MDIFRLTAISIGLALILLSVHFAFPNFFANLFTG